MTKNNNERWEPYKVQNRKRRTKLMKQKITAGDKHVVMQCYKRTAKH